MMMFPFVVEGIDGETYLVLFPSDLELEARAWMCQTTDLVLPHAFVDSFSLSDATYRLSRQDILTTTDALVPLLATMTEPCWYRIESDLSYNTIAKRW